MLRKTQHTVTEFARMGGGYILSSSIVSKILSFLVSMVAIRMLESAVYGQVVFAISVLNFLLPFMGGGAHLGLLRFGPLLNSKTDKNALYKISQKKGLYISLALWCFLLLLCLTNVFKEQNIIFICLVGIQVIALFPMEHLKSHLRVSLNNKSFSYIDVILQGLSLILLIILIPFFDGIGFILALIIAPLLTILISKTFVPAATGKSTKTPDGFWKYSIQTSLNNSASSLIYFLDFLLIGFLISDATELAGYRVSSILPISLSFIPIAFLTTHYVHISTNYKNRQYLDSFIKKYFALFIPIGIATAASLWILSSWVLPFLFGEEYASFSRILQILSLGVMGIFCLRIPFGNLLAGIGQASHNLITSLITLGLNLILNLILIPKFGISGAAWATVISLWFSGFVALLFFIKYLNALPHDSGQSN